MEVLERLRRVTSDRYISRPLRMTSTNRVFFSALLGSSATVTVSTGGATQMAASACTTAVCPVTVPAMSSSRSRETVPRLPRSTTVRQSRARARTASPTGTLGWVKLAEVQSWPYRPELARSSRCVSAAPASATFRGSVRSPAIVATAQSLPVCAKNATPVRTFVRAKYLLLTSAQLPHSHSP